MSCFLFVYGVSLFLLLVWSGFFVSFSFGSLHTLVWSFELWNSWIFRKSYFCYCLILFSLFSWWILGVFNPEYAFSSSSNDKQNKFAQTLIKKILVSLINILVILGMVKWIKTPTFNLINFITLLCGSSGIGYFTCSMSFSSIFPLYFLMNNWLKTSTRQIRISLWNFEWKAVHMKWYCFTEEI